MTETVRFPESPLLGGSLWSPDRRGEPSRRRRPSVHVAQRDPAHPFISSHPTVASTRAALQDLASNSSDLKGKGKEDEHDAGPVLRHALRWGLERADVELVSWLCGLDGRWRETLDRQANELEDDDGWGVVGMAIQGSCGHREKEAVVRAVVGRWGLQAGPRQGRDHAGWTPLHLAAIISTPPLISFLLTRGASTSAETDRGLTPFDMVVGMVGKGEIMLLLERTDRPDTADNRSVDDDRRKALAAHRLRMMQSNRQQEAAEKLDREAVVRGQWLRGQAQLLDIDAELLLPSAPQRHQDPDALDENDDLSDSTEEDDQYHAATTRSRNTLDGMLVFAPWNLDTILDIFITSYRPIAQPAERRGLPAIAVHRYACFAIAHWELEELESLLYGAVERMEKEIDATGVDLARLTFWMYNAIMLLHLLRTDDKLRDICASIAYFDTLEELIHAIHVFIIRQTEIRVDTLLDSALLDHEPLDEVSDVRFEGEWNLFGRPLTLKKKRDTIPRAGSIFANGNGIGTPDKSPLPAASSIFGSVKSDSPFKTPSRPQSMVDAASKTPRLGGNDTPGTPLVAENGAVQPAQITEILSGVLLVLQLYELNPAIIVQIFSQVFLWISCELFNRILTRKKYLCRSKAVQIRMNITVIDDWVRANGLPIKTSAQPFEPVSQLLQWLQCLSQISDFDTLIVTMQNMRSINPLQLRRAVKDYKYEVGEGRMTEECAQYLNQVQKDWEKRRIEVGKERMSQASSSSEAVPDASSIDALFDGSTQLAEWTPESPPECLGELLDSRFMLAFVLPSDSDYLVARPLAGFAFQNFTSQNAFIVDEATGSSRPASRASYSSTRPLGFRLPSHREVRRLPDDFFSWLKQQEADHRLKRDSLKITRRLPAHDPPLGPSRRPQLAAQPVPIPIDTGDRRGYEDTDKTPISHPAATVPSAGFPSPGLTTSSSMDELRAQARKQVHSADFKPIPPASHQRTESYELSVRSSPSRSEHVKSFSESGQLLSPTPSRIATSPAVLSPTIQPKSSWLRAGGAKSRREASEDTVMEDLSTPMGRTPAATDDGHFWDK